MTKLVRVLICLLWFVISSDLAGAKSIKESDQKKHDMRIAKIDLSMAAALHPKMSLFNFSRMGFYRAPLGLSKEEFDKKIEEVKKNFDDTELRKRVRENYRKINLLNREAEAIEREQNAVNPDRMEPKAAEKYLKKHRKILGLLNENEELNFAIRYPEVTKPSETRKILDKIEKEIIEAIKTVAERDSFDVVLNNSIPVPYGYPVSYKSGSRPRTGIAGIRQTLYYAFISERPVTPWEKETASEQLKYWLSMTSRPNIQKMLPVKPWPLVLEGGCCILPEVLILIYIEYNVSTEVWNKLLSVISQTDQADQTGE